MPPKQEQENLFKNSVQQNYYFKTISTGLKAFPILIKKQLLFKDLQLMLENGYLAAVMWNKEIEEQILEKIIQIQQNVQGIFSLKDLYFSDVQQLKLEILNYQPSNQGNNLVINELKIFGKKIRSMNKLLAGQFGQYKLEDLLKNAINFFCKIKLKNSYSNQTQDNQIRLRCIIEQILNNPNPIEIFNENHNFFWYQDEDELVRIIQNYNTLLKPLNNLKIAQFFLSFIFGKNINYLKYQLDFLQTFKDSNNEIFQEKLEVLINDFSEFKQWAIQWTVDKYINCDSTISHPIVAKNVLELLNQSQCLVKYSDLKDEDIFQFLLNLINKIKTTVSEINQQDLNYEESEIKTQIKNVIDIICQRRNITDIDIENLNENVLIESLLKELRNTLKANVTLIGYFDFTRDMQSFLIIENFYLTYLLSYYGHQFKIFFSNQNNNQIQEKTLGLFKQYMKEESSKMQQQGQSFIQATMNIFSRAQYVFGQNNQEQQQYDQCLQDFPRVLKTYFQTSFKKQYPTINQISKFVEQEGQQFSKQLDWYKQYLKRYTQDLFLKLSNELNGHLLQTIFLQLTKKWIKSLEQKLFHQFIPYLNMQEFIKTKQFTDLCSQDISLYKGKYEYLNSKFQAYKEFIQASLNQYKQVTQISQDQEEKINEFEKNLLEQYMLKILEIELIQNQSEKEINVKFEEQVEISFQIKEFMKTSIKESISSKIQSIQIKKGELFEQYKQAFDWYYLPFECIENQIHEIVWYKPNNEQQIYLQELKDFSQTIGIQVENKCLKFQKLFKFGFTDKNQQDLEQQIKLLIIEEIYELKITEETKNLILNMIGQTMELYYGFSEEQINRNIQEKQDHLLNQYLREIYDLTKQQCEEILIPEIPLVEFKIDKLQDYRPQFIKIVEESQNQKDLERRTFQYFQHHALSFVLEDYQNQIEKKLKEVNDPNSVIV